MEQKLFYLHHSWPGHRPEGDGQLGCERNHGQPMQQTDAQAPALVRDVRSHLRRLAFIEIGRVLMFFFISKLVGFFLIPSNLLVLLGLLGILVLLVGRRRWGRRCVMASVLLLAICGWSPLGPGALMVLEDRFPQPVIDRPVAGIILLGGAVDTHISSDRGIPTMNEAGERLTATVDLSRRYPNARIFLSGGASHILGGNARMSESQVAREILVSLGVAPQRIEMEERSRNTCENGTESKAAIRPKTGELWLLVTSASHMPRAVGCFRAAGFDVTPYPVDYRTRGVDDLKGISKSIAVGLTTTDLATHEWFGLLAYRTAGLTAELFPSPHQVFAQ